MTSTYRSSSSIFKLNQDTPEIHPWDKFGPNAINICWVIVFTSEKLQIFMFKLTPVTSKIGQGHPYFEPNQDTLEIHTWYKFGPNAIIIWWVIVFTSKNYKFACLNWPPVTSKIGQGHPSSNLTKTLLKYIHGISLGPMRLIFVELSCLQAKIANFHV